MKCPQCGAENSENSTFCSLCLGKVGAAPQAHSVSAPLGSGACRDLSQRQYVSPGDFRSLAAGMYGNPSSSPAQPYNGYYQAAMSHPGAMAAAVPPSIGQRMTPGLAVVLVIGRSFLAYLLLFAVNFLIGLFLLGAAFSGSETGFNLGIGLMYGAQALILIFSGYTISLKASDPGKGWLYGLACVGMVIFFWEPLVAMVFTLFTAGRLFVPIFSLIGVVIAVLLFMPLGALGGWIADKRYCG